MYRAILVNKNAMNVIINARSFSKLMRKIENYVRTQRIILDEGERLFFPKDQREFIAREGDIEITHRFLIMDWQNVCHSGQCTTTWKLEVIK